MIALRCQHCGRSVNAISAPSPINCKYCGQGMVLPLPEKKEALLVKLRAAWQRVRRTRVRV